MELKRLNIFANDRKSPTIILTYIITDRKSKRLKSFKMWVREDVSQDYEILNYANRLYYEIVVFQRQPQEKHVHRAYQVICGDKLWENYTESKNVVFDEYAITIRPEKNFIEFYKDYMKDFVQKHSMNYIKKENVKL